jgi:hypothetical protein
MGFPRAQGDFDRSTRKCLCKRKIRAESRPERARLRHMTDYCLLQLYHGAG